MASLSGTQNSGSEEDLLRPVMMDQRKRKRMESNRESARRSRVKKQKHMDDLTGQISRLIQENNQISTTVNVTTQHCVVLEAKNSVLKAQMMELTQRLHSLNEILDFINRSAAAAGAVGGAVFGAEVIRHRGFGDQGFLNNPWNLVGSDNQQHPIMASAEIIDYY